GPFRLSPLKEALCSQASVRWQPRRFSTRIRTMNLRAFTRSGPRSSWIFEDEGRFGSNGKDSRQLKIYVDDFSRRKTIKPGRRSAAVSADVFRINQVLDFQLRQRF